MRKSRFTEAQIIGMIKEQEAGLPTAELCRKHGLSPATFYKLKAKYGGMDLSDAKRLKQLEDENAKLKRLVADALYPLRVAMIDIKPGTHFTHAPANLAGWHRFIQPVLIKCGVKCHRDSFFVHILPLR